MALAHDAQSFLDFTSSNSFTHTPVGTPRAVMVSIAVSTLSTDNVSGVTYGGVTMHRVNTAVDTATEPARVYQYFLGSNIPTGAQTVAVTVASGISTKTAWCQTFTASTDCQVVSTAKLEDDTTNPFVYMGTMAGFSGIVTGIYYSGISTASSLTAGVGYTKLTGSAAGGRTFTASSCTCAYGAKSGIGILMEWTATVDDCAFAAAAIAEKPSAYGVEDFPATGTWVCPPGVTSVFVVCRGGGGGGGGVAADTNKASAGGAGGQIAYKVVTVTPGTTYTVTVGAAGTAGASTGTNGGAGGDTWFNTITEVIAKGGAGGQSFENGFTGGAGSTTGGIGDTVRAGGSGGNGGNFAGSGGGGEGGNYNATGANGGNGATGVGGAGGATTWGGGGNGGAGSTNSPGVAGSVPGGGGSGASTTVTTNRAGAAGGAGNVRLIYLVPAMTNLTDNFNDNSINTALYTITNDGAASTVESGTQFNQTSTTTANQYTRETTKAPYDCTGTFASIQLVSAGNTALATFEANFNLVNFNNTANFINVNINAGNIFFNAFTDGGSISLGSGVTYNAGVHKYLRFREASGILYIEYSTSGIEGSFANLITPVNLPMPLWAVTYNLNTGTYGTEASTSTFVWDNLNILAVAVFIAPQPLTIQQARKRASFF